MPCAISTFSDSSDRNSSVVSDRQIAGSAARTVARTGLPSSTFSKPSTAGASIVARQLGVDGHASVEQELQRLRRTALFVEHAPRLVADLAAEAGDPEELVDRHEVEDLHPPQTIGELDRRERFEPQRAPALGRQPLRRQRPGRRLEDRPVARVPVRQHVLEVVGQRPELPPLDRLDRRRRNHFLVVVHELRERVFDVADARLEDHVAFLHALGFRHLVDEQHHAAAHLAREQVVEILDRARSQPGIGMGQARS